MLVPEEYLSQKPAPEPIQVIPQIEAEQPITTIEVSSSTQSTSNPTTPVAWIFIMTGVLLCGGLLLFLTVGNDSLSSFFQPNQSESTPLPLRVQGPDVPVIPTFTPLAGLLLRFGELGSEPGQFDDPRYIAIDLQGNIFIGNYSGGRVQKFDPQGNFLLLIDVPAPDTGGEIYMSGMGADSQGRLYVNRNGDILVYDTTNGNLINTIPNGWPDIYYDALHVAGDFLYTSNGMAGTDDLLKLSPVGEVLFHRQEVIESVDKDDPALSLQIAVDPQGQIYVLSSFGPHIYVYDVLGNYLFRFGEEGHDAGQIDLGSDLIAIDPRSRLYVASSYRIDQFDTQGNYLDYSFDVFDDSENGVPMGMTFDSQGFLYIVCNNGRVLKYQINSP
jgi:sugar lactone lactonase YvrE